MGNRYIDSQRHSVDMIHVSSERIGCGGISRVRVAMVTRGRCARNKACLSARVLAGAVLGPGNGWWIHFLCWGQEMA